MGVTVVVTGVPFVFVPVMVPVVIIVLFVLFNVTNSKCYGAVRCGAVRYVLLILFYMQVLWRLFVTVPGSTTDN